MEYIYFLNAIIINDLLCDIILVSVVEIKIYLKHRFTCFYNLILIRIIFDFFFSDNSYLEGKQFPFNTSCNS